MSKLQAIKYCRGSLQVLDQLRLPHEFHYDDVKTHREAFDAIASMRVRGAPAIAIVAALGLAVELQNAPVPGSSAQEAIAYIDNALDHLKTSRPTAVDLSNAIERLKACIRAAAANSKDAVIETFVGEAETMLREDLQANKSIGRFGADWLCARAGALSAPGSPVSILTHCNTGSLATSGHGTALGIVRTLHERGLLNHAFCTETRPYNQGSRLTAFELTYESIPSTLITDSMAASLFRIRGTTMNIGAVIVGADRVARNGDTANKIGTYQLAVLARHHGIKFIVAAPTTSIDLRTQAGRDIEIEERKASELTQISGAIVKADGTVDTNSTARIAIADQTVNVWNPAFDVTPADLIDVIVTEAGAVEKGANGCFDFTVLMPKRWAQVMQVHAS